MGLSTTPGNLFLELLACLVVLDHGLCFGVRGFMGRA